LLTAIGTASAQDAGDDPADVWSVVESQWNAEEKNDKKWLDRMLTEDFEGWGKNSPAPRDRSSTKMWDRFADEQGKTVAHELYPLSIIVHDDLAIAHYLYTNAFEDKDGEIEVKNGRYTDVLVRTEEGWKFIAWHGGDDE
jgi:ketosteroid isomerase-like protein